MDIMNTDNDESVEKLSNYDCVHKMGGFMNDLF